MLHLRDFRFIAAVAAIGYFVLITPLLAHSAYFGGKAREIELPNGTPGAVRMLFGDGIFFADPVRAAIVGVNGAYYGLSPMSSPLAVDCKDIVQCRVFDLGQGRILVPKIGNARHFSSTDDAFYTRDSWGFDSRPMSLDDGISGHWRHAVERPGAVAFFFIFGFLATHTALSAQRWPTKSGAVQIVFWCAAQTLRLATVLFLLLLTLYVLFLLGVSTAVAAISFAAGALMSFLLKLNRAKARLA